MHELEDEFPDMLKSMMGLHPCDVKSDYKQVLQEMGQWFDKRSYVGVGEVGMDLYWDRSTQEWQQEALLIQLEWAKLYNLPLSLHTRSATQEVIQLLKPFKGQVRGVFHCFSESIELANEIIKLGFKLGIGGVVTFKKAGIREVVAQLDLAHLVLETDSPYLAPTPFRGKRNEPAYVKLIAEEVAQLTGHTVDQVAAITTANAKDVFGL
jgi:TatD DNase family protein